MLGMAQVKVEHKNKEKNLSVVVVGGEGPNLLGRSWLQELAMMAESLNAITAAKSCGSNFTPSPDTSRPR